MSLQNEKDLILYVQKVALSSAWKIEDQDLGTAAQVSAFLEPNHQE